MKKFMMALWVVIVRLMLLPVLFVAAIIDIVGRIIRGESLKDYMERANEAVIAYNKLCRDAIRNS